MGAGGRAGGRGAEQIGGFQGRVNKVADTCYSFWVGGTLKLLGELPLASADDISAFVATCEKKYTGGFSKTADDDHPDILHSFYSLCWFSLIEDHSRALRRLDPALAICESGGTTEHVIEGDGGGGGAADG